MNTMVRAIQHGGLKMSKGSSSMPKSQWNELRGLAARAKDRLVEAGTWSVEVESRQEVSARVKKGATADESVASA